MPASVTPALATDRLTISQIETVLGRAVKDPTFAAALQADPAAALKPLVLHPDEITFFTSLGALGFITAATTLHATQPGHYMTEA